MFKIQVFRPTLRPLLLDGHHWKSHDSMQNLHSKKIGFLRNPRKRFRRGVKGSKFVQSVKKRIKKSTKPLKVLPSDTNSKPSNTKPLEFRINPWWYRIEPKGLIRNSKGFVFEVFEFVSRGRTIKGFVDFCYPFLKLWTHLDAFRHLRNLFWGFRKKPIFLECNSAVNATN
jgi:hypothetical protein